jgi:hypothetical protein
MVFENLPPAEEKLNKYLFGSPKSFIFKFYLNKAGDKLSTTKTKQAIIGIDTFLSII